MGLGLSTIGLKGVWSSQRNPPYGRRVQGRVVSGTVDGDIWQELLSGSGLQQILSLSK